MTEIENLTNGAAYERLTQNGYLPVGAISKGRGYMAAEEPAAIECCRASDARKGVATLIVLTRDAKLRAAINAILKSQGLTGAPVRIGSDGSEHHLVRVDQCGYTPRTREWIPSWLRADAPAVEPAVIDKPAVVFEYANESPDGPLEWRPIRVSGVWRDEVSPLTTPRAKLPSIAVGALFEALDLIADLNPKPVPVPTQAPAVRTFIPRSEREPTEAERICEANRVTFGPKTSLRDFLGNPAALQAHLEAVRRGEAEALPNNPPPPPRQPLSPLAALDRKVRRS